MLRHVSAWIKPILFACNGNYAVSFPYSPQKISDKNKCLVMPEHLSDITRHSLLYRILVIQNIIFIFSVSIFQCFNLSCHFQLERRSCVIISGFQCILQSGADGLLAFLVLTQFNTDSLDSFPTLLVQIVIIFKMLEDAEFCLYCRNDAVFQFIGPAIKDRSYEGVNDIRSQGIPCSTLTLSGLARIILTFSQTVAGGLPNSASRSSSVKSSNTFSSQR